MRTKILAVVGPTASGKSALAIELAERIGGEIICCDSMQIYKKMDIGTAKPTREEICRVPHHLFDFADPEVPFSCADYIPLAEEKISEICTKGRVPVLCGGTGLYLDRLLSGADFEQTSIDTEFREEMNRFALEHGSLALHDRLREVDPVAADEIHPNNIKRVIRALEIYKTSGRRKSDIDRESKLHESRYDASVIGIRYNDREILYDRINRRVDMMMEMGLLEETQALLADGIFAKNSTAAQAIGYKELLSYFKGNKSLEDAVEDLKTASRRYAKRQMTWFSSHSDVRWIEADGKSLSEIADEAEHYI